MGIALPQVFRCLSTSALNRRVGDGSPVTEQALLLNRLAGHRPRAAILDLFRIYYSHPSECREELVEVLEEQYGLSGEESSASAAAFLQQFRLCPDHEDYGLDQWRVLLWKNALPNIYRKYAGDVFVQWLELRYHYLALKTDVIELLRSLREKYLLGLITNGPSRAQWEKVERLQLRQYFDCILVSGDLPWEKPDQQIFHRACRLLGVEPRECIMVGDKLETDIQGGIEAELGGTVWVPISESAKHEELTALPDHTIDSVMELPELLLSPCKARPPPTAASPGAVPS